MHSQNSDHAVVTAYSFYLFKFTVAERKSWYRETIKLQIINVFRKAKPQSASKPANVWPSCSVILLLLWASAH